MFAGFEDEMIDFFWAVRFNNNRAWFAEHKPTYVSKVSAHIVRRIALFVLPELL